jgi:hypothetical protein
MVLDGFVKNMQLSDGVRAGDDLKMQRSGS